MASPAPVQLLVWLAAALMAAQCVIVLWRALVRPRGLPREACCPTCRYPVEGLEGWHCPECGSDLRVVGVTTAHLELSRRSGTFPALLACTVLCLMLGLIAGSYASSWARSAAASARAAAPTVTKTAQRLTLTPRAQYNRSITVEAAHLIGPGQADAPEVTIAGRVGRGAAQLITLTPGGSFTWTDPSGAVVASGEALTEGELVEFLIATGASAESAPDEAAELFAAIGEVRRPPTGPMVATGRGGALLRSGVAVRQSTSQLPVDTSFYERVPQLTWGGAVLIWLLALLLIPLRRRSMLRRAAAPGAQPGPRREPAPGELSSA